MKTGLTIFLTIVGTGLMLLYIATRMPPAPKVNHLPRSVASARI